MVYAKYSCPTREDILKPFLDLLLKSYLCYKSSNTTYTEIAKELHSKVGNLNDSVEVRTLCSISLFDNWTV